MAVSKITNNLSKSEYDHTWGAPDYLDVQSTSELSGIIFNTNNYPKTITFNCWLSADFPEAYGSGIVLPCKDTSERKIIYIAQNIYVGYVKKNANNTITYRWVAVNTTAL